MCNQLRLSVAAAFAALALVLAVGAAGAAEATIAPAGSIESSSNGQVTFGDGIMAFDCNLTLNGSLASGPVALTRGTTLGAITEVRLGVCDAGDVDGILSLPWDIELTALLGTAPNELTGFSVTVSPLSLLLSGLFGLSCLWSGEGAMLQALTRTRRSGLYTTGVQFMLAEVTIPRRSGTSNCPSSISFRGTLDIEPRQSITVS